MTSKYESVHRQIPWAGNIEKTMTSNWKHPRNVDHCCTWSKFNHSLYKLPNSRRMFSSSKLKSMRAFSQRSTFTRYSIPFESFSASTAKRTISVGAVRVLVTWTGIRRTLIDIWCHKAKSSMVIRQYRGRRKPTFCDRVSIRLPRYS